MENINSYRQIISDSVLKVKNIEVLKQIEELLNLEKKSNNQELEKNLAQSLKDIENKKTQEHQTVMNNFRTKYAI